jgi:type I restriction enzyme S subunit
MKWSEVKFAKVAEIVTGNTPPKKDPDNYGIGVPWVKPPDLDAWEPITQTAENISPKGQKCARLLSPGTVMVCCIGSIGRVGIAGTTLATNQQINSLIFGNLVEPRFGYYYCRLITPQFQAAARNAVVPILNKSNFAKITMPIPPLSEQRRIVEILDQADTLRKKRSEVDARAARILPALFYKMFGDPATNPKGWRFKPLTDFGAQVRYGLGQPPKISSTGVPLIRATNISRGTISSVDMIYIDPQDVPPERNAFLKENEVLVVRSGAYTGDVAQVTKEWKDCVAGYDLVITPGRYLTGEFVEAYLLMPFIQKGYFRNLKARAGQPHLNAAQVAATPFLDVPRYLQVQFSEAVQSMRNLRKQRAAANVNLSKTFAVILHRAFTGDLTAKWREAHMKELLAEMEQQAKVLRINDCGLPTEKDRRSKIVNHKSFIGDDTTCPTCPTNRRSPKS